MARTATKNRIAELIGTNGNGHAKAEAPQVLEPLNRQKLVFNIHGTSPLIVHAWSKKAITQIEEKQQKRAGTTSAKEAKVPEEEMRACFYIDADGDYCIPARAIKMAIVSAATSINDKNFAKTKIRQALFVEGDLLKLNCSKPIMRTDMVRLGGKTADVRYRPEFQEWSCMFTIEYNANVYSTAQITHLIELAGFAVGLGEWRPEKNGNNGRFSLTKKG